MIRQRNQDAATQADAMPFLMLTLGAASIVWNLGAVLVSQTVKVVERNFGNK